MQRLSFYKHLSLYSHKNKLDMKPLILSFFAVLLGYSFFFDKDDEIKLRNVDQISLESNSTMPERGDSVTLYAKRLPIFYESQNRRIISLRSEIFVLKYLFI